MASSIDLGLISKEVRRTAYSVRLPEMQNCNALGSSGKNRVCRQQILVALMRWRNVAQMSKRASDTQETGGRNAFNTNHLCS